MKAMSTATLLSLVALVSVAQAQSPYPTYPQGPSQGPGQQRPGQGPDRGRPRPGDRPQDFRPGFPEFHRFYIGETVVVVVRQGRTTGTVQRIDGDGYMVVSTPGGYDNYQGPMNNVMWPVSELSGFRTGQQVTVIVRQGRVVGTIQRIDSDGYVIVSTPGGYDNYSGPISGLLETDTGGPSSPFPSRWNVGDEVVVTVRQGRTTGRLQRIDGDRFCVVSTPGGYDNYEGDCRNMLRVLQHYQGFSRGERVAVDVRQGRTTGEIQRIDSDGFFIVSTPGGYDNYSGYSNGIFHILDSLYGFRTGDRVVVVVRQGRTTGTIQRIDSDGRCIVSTPGGYDNYEGPIQNVIRTY